MDLHSSNLCCSKVIIRKPQKEGKKSLGEKYEVPLGQQEKWGDSTRWVTI